MIHAITDGRDTSPTGGEAYLEKVEDEAAKCGAKIATVIGRYYAMDRDKRWERVKVAYDALVRGEGNQASNLVQEIEASYENGVTDEFIHPIIQVDQQQQPIGTIKPNDVVLFFNFRTDRGRELTEVLTQQAFEEYQMQPLELYYVTLTNYDNSFKNIKVVFDKENIKDTLGETLAKAGKKQLRIAETEKYPHVTFFFNGGREEPFDQEERILCPSPKVATYDLQPEMSA